MVYWHKSYRSPFSKELKYFIITSAFEAVGVIQEMKK